MRESSRTELENNTCEGQAEAARFNSMFADCLVYEETGEKYFPEGLEDYIVSSDDPVAVIGATEFYYLLTGTENLDDSLPENKFLQRFSFTDNKNRLVDKDGRLITREGKHVDDEGRFVKWTGEKDFIYVDEGKTYNFRMPVTCHEDFDTLFSKVKDAKTDKVLIVNHKVKRGESLWVIARKYNSTITSICELNIAPFSLSILFSFDKDIT